MFLVGLGGFVYLYVHYSRVIDSRLSGEIFNKASVVYAAPTPIHVGEHTTAEDIVARLRQAGYSADDASSKLGSFHFEDGHLVIHPGPMSFFQGPVIQEGSAALDFQKGTLTSIVSLNSKSSLGNYWLEPKVITTLFGSSRAKRRVVPYKDLPKVLVDAIIAAEDHRFFSHHGVNFFRILGAAWADFRAQRRVQGGSTLTMQLARNFFLSPRRTIRRKLEEIFIAVLLEQRLSKEKIFELYANEIYLGQLGSFGIYGFGEAANAYFNKDVSRLTLPEAALIAGLIRGPNFYSPFNHPNRVLNRRNYVLQEMVDAGSITSQEAETASHAPLGVVRENIGGNQAPYFVDMIKDQLLTHFSEQDLLSQSYRIYTTLDPDLQRAASEAVSTGMAEVDARISKMRHHPKEPANGPKEPQVALVALDPHTGAIKALVGGRNYAESQLNHVLARRQPGSSFKPFVYAAALNSALDGSQQVITPATTLMDEPTSFQYGDKVYEPANYKEEYHGLVTLREALTHSLNVATVQLAQMVGYEKIRDLAIAAGINHDVQATPAIALGAYVATPLEIAGGYTVFSNSGQYEQPQFIFDVSDADGQVLYRAPEVSRQVLDPRVDYLLVNMMESVINEGTGAGVRSRGFTLPAAGKTGTSHDGWFAGFTSNLLTIVWVGYDDDHELNLSGASSALPVWTAFMKSASHLPAYDDAEPFVEPSGIVSVPIDEQGKPVADNSAAMARDEFFIDGTQPHPENPVEKIGGILSKFFHSNKSSITTPAVGAQSPNSVPRPSASQQQTLPGNNTTAEPPPVTKKGGVFKKFFSIFKGNNSKRQSQHPPDATPP